MEHGESLSPQQMGEFLRAGEAVRFAGQSRTEVYAWIQETLLRQEYFRQRKKQRGLIRAYLSKVSGRSLPQLTRLIRQYRQRGKIRVHAYQRRGFPRRYTDRDVALLAAGEVAQRRDQDRSRVTPSGACVFSRLIGCGHSCARTTAAPHPRPASASPSRCSRSRRP